MSQRQTKVLQSISLFLFNSPMHRILKAKPLFTDLFTSWSGRLSKPTWPAKRSCRPSAPFNRRIYSKSHRVRIQNNNCLQNQYLRVSCNNLLPPKPFQSNEKSKETLLQLFVNILWNELEKNENIAAWSAVFTRAQSLIPVILVNFRRLQFWLFRCKEFAFWSATYSHCQRSRLPERCSPPSREKPPYFASLSLELAEWVAVCCGEVKTEIQLSMLL